MIQYYINKFDSRFMAIEKLDGEKVRTLLMGASGILSCYWITSIIHEHLYFKY